MRDAGLYAVYAILLWWGSTGVILYLDGLPKRTFRWSLWGTGALALAGVAGFAFSTSQATPLAAAIAFTSALAIWGWHELAFLTGRVTGPVKTEADPALRGFARFRQAAGTVSDHELALTVTLLAMAWLSWGEVNQVGALTFALLWVMRLSTKLNIFLGAPNITDEFLPPHMAYLKSYFRRRPMNGLFPFAVTAATLLAAYLAHSAIGAPAGSHEQAAYTLLTVLAALGVLEHWLLYAPVPASRLWSWGLSSHKAAEPSEAETSLSLPLERPCDAKGLTQVLDQAAKGRYGRVERIEGAARSGEGWIRFGLTDGRPHLALASSQDGGPAQVIATGRGFDKARLGAAFRSCAA